MGTPKGPTATSESAAASEEQKRAFTQSIISAALRVIGVTPGYDLDFKQASAGGEVGPSPDGEEG